LLRRNLMALSAYHVPYLNTTCIFPHRDSLRRKKPTACLTLPTWLHRASPTLPTAPVVWDLSKSGKAVNPIYANDKLGDCEEAALLHGLGSWSLANGPELVYSPEQAVHLYSSVTGYVPGKPDTDEGTGTDDLMRWWQRPSLSWCPRILDNLAVDPTNVTACELGGFLFGGRFTTISLYPDWIHDFKQGFIWDYVAGSRPDPELGHAIWEWGYTEWGGVASSWGSFGVLTNKGRINADPEVTVCFCPVWFDSRGMAPTGLSWDESALLWSQLGGRTLPTWRQWCLQQSFPDSIILHNPGRPAEYLPVPRPIGWID
jgi:hypothetical protein